MGYHFCIAREKLLPTNEETAKYFGGLPFKCLLCNISFHEKETNDHKFHLLIEHQNLLRKNSAANESANEKIEGNKNGIKLKKNIFLPCIFSYQ